jgi:hypothetical protein
MQGHEHFEELAALAAIGQVTAEEHRQLVEHLRACGVCKQMHDEFAFVLDQLPLPEPSASDRDIQSLQGKSYRRRFLEKASAEGVRFTPEALGERRQRSAVCFSTSWRSYGLGFASAVAMTIVGATIVLFPAISRLTIRPITASKLEAVRPNEVVPSKIPAVDLGTSATALARLQQAHADAARRLDSVRQELAQARADYSRLAEESARWKDQAVHFQGQNQKDELELARATSQLDKLGKDNDQMAASLVAQQFRVEELSAEIEEQKGIVERERQLTAAARDVRDLMGARNLHIIDVADLDGLGKSKKSFGRVFYTEGKSLIFYAFDLSQKGSAAKVSFQAWGQNQGSSNSVKNLGVFYIDDQAQKRWVLRVDKPELLRTIESVFVTVEPSPGSDKPSGHKLLYAYLGTQANHP